MKLISDDDMSAEEVDIITIDLSVLARELTTGSSSGSRHKAETVTVCTTSVARHSASLAVMEHSSDTVTVVPSQPPGFSGQALETVTVL